MLCRLGKGGGTRDLRLGIKTGVEPLLGPGSGVPGGGSGCPLPIGIFKSTGGSESFRPFPFPFLSFWRCIAFRPHRLAVAAALDMAVKAPRLGSSDPLLPAGEGGSFRAKMPWPLELVPLLNDVIDADGELVRGMSSTRLSADVVVWRLPGGFGVSSLPGSSGIVSVEECEELPALFFDDGLDGDPTGVSVGELLRDFAEIVAIVLTTSSTSAGEDGLKGSA